VRRIYLASPLGFAESTRDFMRILESKIADCGFSVVNPWRLGDPKQFETAATIKSAEKRKRALHSVNMEVAARNENAIRRCDAVLAVLDGVDVDSGTASEVGFAYALGKRIFGYRSDFRRTGENEGSIVNLQVEYWIEASGGRVVAQLTSLHDLLMEFSRSFAKTKTSELDPKDRHK
jgi:nucleoside 2-deoxyribosyltransferase